MSLTEIKILQVGDVHWPELSKSDIDAKDRLAGPHMSRVASSKALQVLGRAAKSHDAILFVGDLTSRGDLSAYASFLDGVKKLSIDPNKILIVPGNHDVDHKLCQEDQPDAQFKPLNDALTARNFRELPIDAPIYLPVSKGHSHLQIAALNSCLGCGSTKRFLDPDMDKALRATITRKMRKNPDFEQSELFWEILDTPSFDIAHIERVVDEFEQQDPSVLPIVIAHHNLLPQKVPRVTAYGELLNGGLVRDHFSRLDRPLIYLHGHIHTDPVEILTIPNSPKGRIVSISVPDLASRLNSLTFQFNSKGDPLGCIITPKEIHHHIARSPIRIPFWSVTHHPDILTDQARGVYERLQKQKRDKSIPFSELARKIKDQVQDSDIPSVLYELEWFNLINIMPRESDVNSSWIRRVI